MKIPQRLDSSSITYPARFQTRYEEHVTFNHHTSHLKPHGVSQAKHVRILRGPDDKPVVSMKAAKGSGIVFLEPKTHSLMFSLWGPGEVFEHVD
jgi:hypothetical protein